MDYPTRFDSPAMTMAQQLQPAWQSWRAITPTVTSSRRTKKTLQLRTHLGEIFYGGKCTSETMAEETDGVLVGRAAAKVPHLMAEPDNGAAANLAAL